MQKKKNALLWYKILCINNLDFNSKKYNSFRAYILVEKRAIINQPIVALWFKSAIKRHP